MRVKIGLKKLNQDLFADSIIVVSVHGVQVAGNFVVSIPQVFVYSNYLKVMLIAHSIKEKLMKECIYKKFSTNYGAINFMLK